MVTVSAVDPAFFLGWGGDTNSQSGCANLIFYNFFAENCMKMKEFGPDREKAPGMPHPRLDPPMDVNNRQSG